MHITSIRPQFVGPFYSKTELQLEEDVTVLTGSNDVGKSSLLKILRGIYDPSRSAAADEHSVNRVRLLSSGQSWKNDSEIGVHVTFHVDDSEMLVDNGAGIRGDALSTFFCLSPDATGDKQRVRQHTDFQYKTANGGRKNGQFRRLPNVFFVNECDELDNVVEMKEPTHADRCFLRAAFGEQFRYAQLEAMNELNVESMIQHAQDQFENTCAKILPPSLRYRFRFRRLQEQPTKLLIQLADQFQGMVPIRSRGSGARKFIGYLLLLLSFASESPCLILIDEPENSLHADAQRALRKFLELLASAPGVQAVYSTHSPVMINPLRPAAVRLVTQSISFEGQATATIDNKPFSNNFLKVRTSLGLLPSDSLLYSDVAVVVEGQTECLVIPEMLLKLQLAGITGFERATELLSDIHFIDGMGDNFERLCKVAKGQGAKPIVFVDGDKMKQIRNQNFRESHPDVPVINLPDKVEIEQLVPVSKYFLSIAEANELPPDSVTEDAFITWKSRSQIQHIANLAFSKQVDLWLIEMTGRSLEKPRTLLNALKQTEPHEILYLDELRALCREVLSKLCST